MNAPPTLIVGQRGGRRIPRRDLAWRDNTPAHAMILDLTTTVDAIRATLVEFLAQHSETHMRRLLDLTAGRWRSPTDDELKDFVHSIVRPGVSSETSEGLGQLIEDAQLRPLGDLPFRLELGTGSGTFSFRHAYGDGRTVWTLALALLFPERIGEILNPAGLDPSYPLLRALWGTFGRHPRRLVETLRGPRDALPLDAQGTVPLRPEAFAVIGRRSESGFRRELHKFRKATAPEASMIGVMAARGMAALHRHGLRPYEGLAVVADARRYLPDRRLNGGNFSSAAYLSIADPCDPVAVTRAIDSFTESGRPLLTLAAMAARARRGELVQPVWIESDEFPRPMVTFTNMGRLPWPGEPPAAWHALGRPIGRYGLAILTYEIGHYLYASVSYDPRHVSGTVAGAVASAITALD